MTDGARVIRSVRLQGEDALSFDVLRIEASPDGSAALHFMDSQHGYMRNLGRDRLIAVRDEIDAVLALTEPDNEEGRPATDMTGARDQDR